MGHLIVAEFMLSFTDIDKVCFVVSPQNPFKSPDELAPADHRLQMVLDAIDDNPGMMASDVEFTMPRPSFTIDTLDLLTTKYPDVEFCIVLGSDNLLELDQWKDAQRLIDHYRVFVYMRPGFTEGIDASHPNIEVYKAPSLHISSTHIRSCIAQHKSIRYLVPEEIIGYLERHKLYSDHTDGAV